MATQDKANEKQIAGASYLLDFYQEVNNLTHHYAQYSNLLIEAKHKYGKEIDSLDENAKGILVTEVQSVRYYAYRCYIMYETLRPSLKLKKNTKLKEAYDKVKDVYIMKQEELEKFVIALNSVLVQEVIKDLLDTSQALIATVYQNDATTDTPAANQE